MKLIVGLGNPGKKYQNNRHNIGFVVLDALSNKISNVQFLKPQTFMNRSGIEVKKWVKKYQIKPEDLFVIHDDLDIPIGKFKINFGKGPKVHNGLQSIYSELATKDFWHVRVGIDADRGGKTPEEFVLSNFRPEEREIIKISIIKIIKVICQALKHPSH